jgi:peptide/nickel transport system substrate-binding protein
MDNRFGIKDFFLFLLVVIVIIMIALAMKQYDRQYQLVLDTQRQSNDQLRELEAIHQLLQHGVAFSPSGSAAGSEESDPTPALRALREQGKYDQGDWLVQNFAAPVGKITPFLGDDLYAYVMQDRVLETLAYQDPDTLDFMPLLAASWTTTDNIKAWQTYVDQRKAVAITEDDIVKEADCPPPDKADARKQYIADRLKQGRRPEDIGAEPDCPPAVIIDFKLRRGVTFSDGSPFNADDVVFTYNWVMNPRVDAPRDRSYLERIKSVEKVNDYDIVFKFKVPYYQSFMLAASMNVLSKKFYGAYTPEQFNDSVGLLFGTGPYRLASPTDWKPQPGKIELFRNERYWGLAPSFDRLVFYQIEQDSTNLVMYGNGELDIVGLFPQQYRSIKDKPEFMDHSNTMIYGSPLAGYLFIGWNENRAGKPTIFADKRVRQAMTMLADREGICKNIFLGYAEPAPGPFEAQSPQHDPALVDWKYDPDAAKALLREAGFEDRNGEGVLSRGDGARLSFKLRYPSKNETTDRIMQYLKDNYARAGIDMELDPADWTIVDQQLKNHDFDAVSLGWGGGSLEDDIYQIFDSSQIKNQGDNFVSYSDPQFDATLNKARQTLDLDQRMKLWHECERILHDDQPYTFLINTKAIRLFDKRIQNVHVARTGLNLVQDWVMPIPWYVPSAQQKYK